MKKIPFHRASISSREIREVTSVLKSGWLTSGPKTAKFEEDFKSYIGCRNAIALNSCTAGLHLALAACGVGKGDEVITTPITFPSTVNVVLHLGAIPVFADVNVETLTLCPKAVERKITAKTKAVIPVHLAGYPCEMDAIMSVAKGRKLSVIEDAAHAVETIYKGKKIGTIADFASFSFYATKNITTGEGGMLVTDHDELAERVKIMSLHGISKDAWKRYGNGGYQHWDLIEPGFKYNMFDIQAALGIEQLKRVGSFYKKREKIVMRYDKALKNNPLVRIIQKPKGSVHGNHLYVVVLNIDSLTVGRDEIMNELQSQGINVGVHFRALHTMSYFQKNFRSSSWEVPNAEFLSNRLISLPLFPSMKMAEVDYVSDVFNKTLLKFSKKTFQS
ncbi:MAG: DegT/DnrJ/EryC1/StrS family aminotransferase [Nitrospinota bacterium]